MLSREAVKTPWMFIRRPEANTLRSGVGILAVVQRKGLGQRFTNWGQRMYLRREAPENYFQPWCLPLALFFAASIPQISLFEAV